MRNNHFYLYNMYKYLIIAILISSSVFAEIKELNGSSDNATDSLDVSAELLKEATILHGFNDLSSSINLGSFSGFTNKCQVGQLPSGVNTCSKDDIAGVYKVGMQVIVRTSLGGNIRVDLDYSLNGSAGPNNNSQHKMSLINQQGETPINITSIDNVEQQGSVSEYRVSSVDGSFQQDVLFFQVEFPFSGTDAINSMLWSINIDMSSPDLL
jgi:hypothetical protein